MSVREASEPHCVEGDGPVQLLIESKPKDLGELVVRRTLPGPQRQRVGPFIFFDHIGPAHFRGGSGVNVRPHPHIGLATITYLFAGQIMHRDSLGYAQLIERGAINWMTAGRGIVHSERTPEQLKKTGSRIHGIQAWVALPLADEETEPRFQHYPATEVPELSVNGVILRVIAGQAYGAASPVQTCSETLYVEADFGPGAELSLPEGVDELAVYVVEGEIVVGECPVGEGRMAVIRPGGSAIAGATRKTKAIILGGATLPGQRLIWWNFVSSSQERLERAKADWREKRFEQIPGEYDFIPLPES